MSYNPQSIAKFYNLPINKEDANEFSVGKRAKLLMANPIFEEVINEILSEIYTDDDRITLDTSLTREQKQERREANANLRAAIYKLNQKLNSKILAAE